MTAGPDFGLLQERLGDKSAPGLVYQAFDLLYLDGRIAARRRRSRTASGCSRACSGRTRASASRPTSTARARAFYEAAEAQGLEGIIAKLRRSRYEPGRRSSAWLKIKIRPEQELVVGGWTPGRRATPATSGALVVGVYEDGHAAVHRQGRLRVHGRDAPDSSCERLAPLTPTDPPFDPPPPKDYRGRWGGDLRDVTWVRPELVIRAELGGWSRDGMVRQAAFKGIDEGRDPTTVARERPVATASRGPGRRGRRPADGDRVADSEVEAGRAERAPPIPGAPPTTNSPPSTRWARKASGPIGGNDLKVTNLDKPIFEADPPITKRELIRYFARIAPTMLPHLDDRPLNLQRFPNGAGAPGFWQKDIPATAPDVADPLARDRRRRSRGPDRERPPHRRPGRDPRLARQPDELRDPRLDRAPARCPGSRPSPTSTSTPATRRPGTRRWSSRGSTGPRSGTSACAAIRRRPASAASRSGSPSCRATTSPTRARGSRSISRAVGSTVPDLVSWEWAKGARKGRARLDYTQNASIKTLVAPYAVRPSPGAPVSAPIAWDELDDPDLRPDRWTIRTIVERVAERGRPVRRRPDRRSGAAATSERLSTVAAAPGTSGSRARSEWRRPRQARSSWPRSLVDDAEPVAGRYGASSAAGAVRDLAVTSCQLDPTEQVKVATSHPRRALRPSTSDRTRLTLQTLPSPVSIVQGTLQRRLSADGVDQDIAIDDRQGHWLPTVALGPQPASPPGDRPADRLVRIPVDDRRDPSTCQRPSWRAVRTRLGSLTRGSCPSRWPRVSTGIVTCPVDGRAVESGGPYPT